MTLLDILDAIPQFIARHPFPVFVEGRGGDLYEVDKIDFRNGCAGTVLVAHMPSGDDWDDDLIELRDAIRAEWDAERSDAAHVFDPTGNVIPVEAAYRLLNQALKLLEQMYE